MTIQELINIIPFKILKRGENYFYTGKILQLNQGKDGTWFGRVEGNYGNYEVEIKPDKNSESASYSCSCPFDGAICKHVAAVALAINEEESWEQLIKDAKPKDLRNFMLDFGVRNQDFRHQIKLAFSKPVSVENTDNTPYYRSQINDIFDNYNYQGFIDYRHSSQAMSEITQFQIKADNYYSRGNLNEAFCISAAIAMEGVKAIQYMDDSSGECGSAIYEAFQVIESILNNNEASSELKKRIFDWLQEQVRNSDYRDYGVGDSLEPLFFDTAASLRRIDIAYEFIDAAIIELDKEDGWSKNYYLQRYLGEKIKLLQSEGRTAEADNIINAYLHFVQFRQIRVEQALSTNSSDKAEKLILDGIKIAQQENASGTVHQWKDQLLDLYKQQKQAFKYNRLARDLFIDNPSDIKYFKTYKQTSPKAGWEENREKLIAELRNKRRGYVNGISIDNLANIYIEEQMIDELFALVSSSNSIHTLIRYTDHLKEQYSPELLQYYNTAIEEEAKQTGRDAYVSMVQHLSQMSKINGGLSAAKELKDVLLNKYTNRPAMKEEFKKLNWD